MSGWQRIGVVISVLVAEWSNERIRRIRSYWRWYQTASW